MKGPDDLVDLTVAPLHQQYGGCIGTGHRLNQFQARRQEMGRMEKKSLRSPEETRTFPKGKFELVTAGGITFGRATLEPG